MAPLEVILAPGEVPVKAFLVDFAEVEQAEQRLTAANHACLERRLACSKNETATTYTWKIMEISFKNWLQGV